MGTNEQLIIKLRNQRTGFYQTKRQRNRVWTKVQLDSKQRNKQTKQRLMKRVRTKEQHKEPNTQVKDLRTDCNPKENLMNRVHTNEETNVLGMD